MRRIAVAGIQRFHQTSQESGRVPEDLRVLLVLQVNNQREGNIHKEALQRWPNLIVRDVHLLVAATQTNV